MAFFCRCCQAVSSTGDPPPCRCCPGQTPTLVGGRCECLPELRCSDGRVVQWPDCDCEPRCPDQCPDGTTPVEYPECCRPIPLPPTHCEACCPIGQEDGGCTPGMMLISIPDALSDPAIVCPTLPADVSQGCSGDVFYKQTNARGCHNGGSYYLICNRSKFLQWGVELDPDRCGSTYHESLNLPTTLEHCCSWTFCKPTAAQDLFAAPFCPVPPECSFFARQIHNQWCYAPFIGVRLLPDADGYYFSISILLPGNCGGTGGPCYGETGQWEGPGADITINGVAMIVGRTPSEPRPLNCFATRTVPLTHFTFGSYWDANHPPTELLPLTPSTWLGICSLTDNPARAACSFPAGLSATIVGLPA